MPPLLGSREKRYFLTGKRGKKKEEERKGGKKEREKGEREEEKRERRFNHNLKAHDKHGYRYNLGIA